MPTLEQLIADGLTGEKARNLFDIVSDDLIDENHMDKLLKLFEFGMKNKDLFPNIKLSKSLTNVSQRANEYFIKWINKYVTERSNPALLKPLKNYGEVDRAIYERVAVLGASFDEQYDDLLEAHFIFMSAENKNGATLEEFLAEVLEDHGWLWCAGSVFRAIDFCYLEEDNVQLLQVKNKYNTENSSSSAIRVGTPIKKWHRLGRPKAATGKHIPIPNWNELISLINAESSLANQLTEDNYLKYIRENSSKELEIIK